MTSESNSGLPPDYSSDAPGGRDRESLLNSLRLTQDFTSSVGVEKVLLTVPVRKPNKGEFFRVHPKHSFEATIVELKAEREVYFVMPTVAPHVAEFAEPVRLYLCVGMADNVFLWPCKLPRDDRRADAWRTSALEVADLAKRRWVRVHADMHLGAYQPFQAMGELKDPVWPKQNFDEVLEIAIKGRLVEAPDHPLVKQLLGMA